MKKILAIFATFTISCTGFSQLADMMQLPEGMEAEAPRYTEQELLRSWGWLLAERFTLKDLEVSPQEVDWISAGIMSHVQGEPPATDLNESQLALQEYFSNRETMIQERQLEKNRREGQDFFDSLFGVPGKLSLGTGLFYEILEPGNDVRPDSSDSVTVHYTGTFLDGTVFDSTEGKAPISFKLGDVIDAWEQGLPLIGEGGKIKLYVPSKLGYGDEPRPGVPPASTLIFEVELIKVGLPEDAEGEVADPSPEEGSVAPAE